MRVMNGSCLEEPEKLIKTVKDVEKGVIGRRLPLSFLMGNGRLYHKSMRGFIAWLIEANLFAG